MDQNQLKKLVGEKSVEWIEDGMIVGLGTGSTVKFMVDALGKRVQEEGLNIIGVTTSNRTAEQARSLNIPLKSVDEVDHIDLTIDGADEISADFQGIKGGGAALLFEKIVATNSKQVMWIVDESKLSQQLGSFPLPVEVIPYGSQKVFERFEAKGLNPTFRKNADGSMLRTDSQNYIIDLHLKEIADPHTLADYLIKQVGVVEHGLFLDMVNTVIVGRQDGPEVLEAR
ncbi:ribose-5-phosphate isomerase RpiA [Ligilactobacillus saerimneri]|uniref:Ribose-5-phosphate isomerase A n=1 Tax=Ligilactobacillus saerimneri 30a TaxID=1227363 RepID=M5J5A9_9LACO|nr:ribose-5-phosphate isomerase RpiA [Ligilactobacillus saerimneri]EKW99251.1 ribose-5-phosphate isomerase A [Ligilactobacillus saerimneri 30a]MBU5310208.1 ribose-5-phosphate isomerase RpiA [Ligilactobacillus saerimneri]MCZ0891132.1 ribose-5-phosphate isomerase RpiA [Ligilactobacillus saerimneri]MDI9206622.1 ribose-5-phosphate isomerase RpiA [Ligilactobacillus saerimneri]MDY4004236.1 ribose-5-phosphate isomerase RpiA [Ligilactobacillus saerimneri]